MYTLQTILSKLKKAKPELEKKYPLKKIGVFGSYARGEETDKSDIDIAVEIDGYMGLSFVVMADEIESLFRIKTDVVPIRSIKPEYLQQIKKRSYMSERKPSVVISDILNCIQHIKNYSGDISFEEF